ncbi:hypothetical protein [Desulforegula conservatrix]|uniref:hypothetical protein n=1 Tax=Desulforegula conservatrix TaxID=153026 RepID=UPI000419B84B|nr:hypothetical protein [Desulforegula conservatrix]
MKTDRILNAIVLLSGMFIFLFIAPSWVQAGYYVSKHGGINHTPAGYHSYKEPWLDVNIFSPVPSRVQEYRTYERHYNNYDDDGYMYSDHNHHKKYHYKHHKKHGPPPGWYTRVRPGYVMPPDIYVYREPVPQYIMVKMPPQPPGVIHVMIGGKIVRLMEATLTIMDVFDM